MLKCIDLLCEYQENPCGIDEKHPRFAWKIESDNVGVLQTAYQIKIDGIWDSGKIESDSFVDAIYEGDKIEPCREYIWSVRVWDNYGEVSEWASASFETALFGNWTADWITCDEERLSSCPVFAKKITIDDCFENVRIYATALGNYEILLNGERVGDEWMMPGFVSYNKRLPYQTFKINNLKKGENEIRVNLTKGWARGQVSLSNDVFGVKVFINEFVTPSGRLTEDTQTAYALALFFDMTDNKERAIKRLAELIEENGMRLNTGFVGTPYLCHALTEYGRSDIAYNLLLQTEYPSWLYSVGKGATTIWEHWDGIKPDGSFWSDDMNSYNHYAYGAIADWLYTKVAGINYDENEPAYKHIIIKPFADKRLGYACAKVETMYGNVVSKWSYENDEIKYSIEIPAGAYADFIFPDGNAKRLGSGKHNL